MINIVIPNGRVVPPSPPRSASHHHQGGDAYESLIGATPGGVNPKTWP